MKNVDKEFDGMVKECKRNKISESLLLLNKALYLQNTIASTANASKTSELKNEQKSIVEVIILKLEIIPVILYPPFLCLSHFVKN